MASFGAREAQSLKTCVDRFTERFRARVSNVVRERMRGYEPPQITELMGELEVIGRQLTVGRKTVSVHDIHLRLLKHILTSERRELAAEVEVPRNMTNDPGTIRHLEMEIRRLDVIIGSTSFADLGSSPVPGLADFLSLRYAEGEFATSDKLAPRVYDEKFHLLEAAHLLIPDLAHYRRRCELRGVDIAVAYLDIDDFKQFNTRYSETRVDRNLLPVFMAALEAHTFAHGHAYRFGGDEYVLLLPNTSLDWAIASMRELQRRLAECRYFGVEPNPTVSIGLCLVTPTCFLTDREVLENANRAKDHAKNEGKACIGYYGGEIYRDANLRIAADKIE